MTTTQTTTQRRPSNAIEVARILNENAEIYAERIIGSEPTSKSAYELRFYPKGGLRVKIRRGAKCGHWSNYGEDHAFGDMLDLIQYCHNVDKPKAIEIGKSMLGMSGDIVPALPAPKVDPEEVARQEREEEAKRLRIANWIWNQSSLPRPGVGPVAAYLASRGITMALPRTIRHRHINAESMGKMNIDASAFPNGLDAAVFAATDAAGRVRAVQQVILHDARKAPIKDVKRTNGSMDGCAFRINDNPAKDIAVLAEGPETGLSVAQATGLPTYVVFGTANYARVDLPARIKRLVIAVDTDANGRGLRAALRAAEHWMARGVKVRLAIPETGDFNDVLQKLGEEAIRDCFRAAADPVPMLQAVAA